ncbi:MAG TPA: glutathione S-transferase family protein [Caulobacteraceae bacterium]|jgi:glutathione S-transferase|nr:glutathione S-transferase family protein [Caulobacteraceae bacterium]
MTLTIYGSPRSRTLRVLWAAAELGLDYEHVPLAFDDPRLKSADFLKLNPAGAVPTIVDDGVVLSESLAINLYLAKTYGAGRLYPATPEGEAQAWKWTLWAQGHLEPWVQQDALLAALRAAMGQASRAVIEHALGLLDRTLDDRAWLVGEGFSVADLNVACVLSPSRVARLDLSPFGCVHDWLARCYGRPAAVATRTRFA